MLRTIRGPLTNASSPQMSYSEAVLLPPVSRIKCIITPNDESAPKMDKERFLLPSDLTASQLIQVVRKRVDLTSEKALFLFSENRLLTGNTTMQSVLDESDRKGGDGILRVKYALENTFG